MMSAGDFDQIRLNFNPTGVMILNFVLAFIMYGVALDIRISDFRRVLEAPRGPLIGLVAQFFLLPAMTYLLTLVMGVAPSIALGMILVAACPGGNVSNFITYLGKGNVALSVSMTAVSSTAAVVMTPVNIAFWGSMQPETKALLTSIDMDAGKLLLTVGGILALPLVLGMLTRAKWEAFADKVHKPIRLISVLCLIGFIAAATAANFEHLITYGTMIFGVVIIHNAIALSTGYGTGLLLRLPVPDRRAISIEVGIQNSGLGLGLVFAFFGGLGGMALVAATWGIWHIVAGLSLSTIWARRSRRQEQSLEENRNGSAA